MRPRPAKQKAQGPSLAHRAEVLPLGDPSSPPCGRALVPSTWQWVEVLAFVHGLRAHSPTERAGPTSCGASLCLAPALLPILAVRPNPCSRGSWGPAGNTRRLYLAWSSGSGIRPSSLLVRSPSPSCSLHLKGTVTTLPGTRAWQVANSRPRAASTGQDVGFRSPVCCRWTAQGCSPRMTSKAHEEKKQFSLMQMFCNCAFFSHHRHFPWPSRIEAPHMRGSVLCSNINASFPHELSLSYRGTRVWWFLKDLKLEFLNGPGVLQLGVPPAG